MTSRSELRYTIPGPPVPKQRPRFDRRSGRVYTPTDTTGYERRARLSAMAACGALMEPWPTDREYRVEVIAYMPDKRVRDVDNIAKAVLDSANRLLWRDDGQVVRVEIERRLDRANPRVEVAAEVIG